MLYFSVVNQQHDFCRLKMSDFENKIHHRSYYDYWFESNMRNIAMNSE